MLGTRSSRKNSGSHIDASLSRQPLVKGERLVRYEVNAVMFKQKDHGSNMAPPANTPCFRTCSAPDNAAKATLLKALRKGHAAEVTQPVDAPASSTAAKRRGDAQAQYTKPGDLQGQFNRELASSTAQRLFGYP
jgi:hypothetical protein